MKYFFLADGWMFNRVWELGGLWDENSRRRKPDIRRLNLGIVEGEQILWLYQVEDSVLMIEVQPLAESKTIPMIGTVILKRLISSDRVIDLLQTAECIVNKTTNPSSKI